MMVAKDDLEIVKFTSGTGTNEPWGLIHDVITTYTGQVQASATGDTFAVADIYALIQQVAERFRYRGSFLANEIIYDIVRGFGEEVKHIWNESLAVDRPPTLLSRPAYGQVSMDATYGSGENYVMAFGDIREAYTIVDRVGMTAEFVPHLFGGTNNYPVGMRGIYAWWRNGAAVTNSSAVAVLNVT
jgi:HK97 family phage major capsid protein